MITAASGPEAQGFQENTETAKRPVCLSLQLDVARAAKVWLLPLLAPPGLGKCFAVVYFIPGSADRDLGHARLRLPVL